MTRCTYLNVYSFRIEDWLTTLKSINAEKYSKRSKKPNSNSLEKLRNHRRYSNKLVARIPLLLVRFNTVLHVLRG